MTGVQTCALPISKATDEHKRAIALFRLGRGREPKAVEAVPPVFKAGDRVCFHKQPGARAVKGNIISASPSGYKIMGLRTDKKNAPPIYDDIPACQIETVEAVEARNESRTRSRRLRHSAQNPCGRLSTGSGGKTRQIKAAEC